MKLKILLTTIAIACLTFVVTAGANPYPNPYNNNSVFKAKVTQDTAAYIDKGNLKFRNNGTYKGGSGSEGGGAEGAMASVKGKNGMGSVLVVGGTLFTANKIAFGAGGKGFYSAGITGNMARAAISPGCWNKAKIEGYGDMGTFAAVKRNNSLGIASTTGTFKYKNSTPFGSVNGYGVTGGASIAFSDTTKVGAFSGQFSLVGTSRNMSNLQ